MLIIKAKGLTKRYKDVVAVNNVSFNIKKGEVFGLLGPNGAGKTTLISMLSTILLPTKGSAKVGSYALRKDAHKIRRMIGLVFQESVLDEDLSAYDNLDIHARLYKIPKAEREKKIKEFLKLVGLHKVASKKVEEFSGGMKRKLELVRGLLNEPSILFLDEPTLGLDPHARKVIWDYIKKLKKEKNITIILTTHYMDEADVLCDRVGIISHGKFVRIDTPARLKDSLKGDVIEIKVGKTGGEVVPLLKKASFVKGVEVVSGHLRVYVSKGEKKIAKILELLKSEGIGVKAITLKKPTLEDVFLHFAREELE